MQTEIEEGYRKWKFHEKRMSMFYQIILPGRKDRMPDTPGVRYVERVEFQNGMWTFFNGHEVPYPGMPDEIIVGKVNEAKKSAMALFWGLGKMLQNRVMGTFFLFIFRKQILISVNSFTDALWENISVVRVRQENYCRCVREFSRAMRVVGVQEKFIDLVSMVLEFDCVYRFRFQWLIENMDFEKDVLAELERLVRSGEERESSDRMQKKWRAVRRLLFYIKINPTLKKKVVSLFRELNKTEIIMSTEDAYWAKERNVSERFNYKGQTN